MERPTKFEHNRWLGDKRTQVVYDVDNIDDPSIIDELMAAETFLCFGPDTLAEARNRGYKPYKGDGSGNGPRPRATRARPGRWSACSPPREASGSGATWPGPAARPAPGRPGS